MLRRRGKGRRPATATTTRGITRRSGERIRHADGRAANSLCSRCPATSRVAVRSAVVVLREFRRVRFRSVSREMCGAVCEIAFRFVARGASCRSRGRLRRPCGGARPSVGWQCTRGGCGRRDYRGSPCSGRVRLPARTFDNPRWIMTPRGWTVCTTTRPADRRRLWPAACRLRRSESCSCTCVPARVPACVCAAF